MAGHQGSVESQRRFAAVVLAAGEATRMGVAKPALPYGSSTMVGSVVDIGRAGGLARIVVVTGFHSTEVVEAVGDSAVIAHNAEPERGNMSSLLVGIDALGDIDVVVVLLADMPGIESGVISGLVDGFVRSDARCGWVEYADGRGHPVVLSRSVFDDIRMLSGPRPLWSFISQLPEGDVFVLRVSSPRPPDVNTPSDYDRATRGNPGF